MPRKARPTASNDSSMVHETAPAPTHAEIAARAYELYRSRGELPGRDIDDWLRAETELTEARKATKRRPS